MLNAPLSAIAVIGPIAGRGPLKAAQQSLDDP
jgi:hypothetical protein